MCSSVVDAMLKLETLLKPEMIFVNPVVNCCHHLTND